MTTVHLCSKCAAERGIETDAERAQTPLGAFLAAMGKGGAPVAAAAAAGEACAGLRRDACRTSAHPAGLAAPSAGSTFERPLRDLLRRLHGATRHTGDDTYRAIG